MLSIVIAAAKLSGWLSQRIGQPAVFGEILIGLILGPSLINFLGWPIFLPHHEGAILAIDAAEAATSSPLFGTLKDLAEVGVIFLMFMAGLETDMKEMKRVGRIALYAALGGVFAPFFFGWGTAESFSILGLDFSFYEAIFIGTILTATSVSISAQTLIELGKLRSKEGTTILGAAVIDDVVGIIILSFVIAFKPAGEGVEKTAGNLVGHIMNWLTNAQIVSESAAGLVRIVILILLMIAFFIVAIWFGRKFFGKILRWAYESPISQGILAAAIVLGLMYAWSAEFIGSVAAITGSYVAGILVGLTDYHETVEQRLHAVTYSMLVPIFFISIGLQANVRPIFDPLAKLFTGAGMSSTETLVLLFTIAIVIVAVLTKVLGCMVGGKIGGFSWNESYRVGVGMISRGEVGLIIATVGLSAGIINRDVFSMMILMVLVTTLVTPIWLKIAFKGKGAADSATTAPEDA